MDIARSAEAVAFLSAVDAAPPDAVSACDGWTTHEIVAHVTGIAVEVCRHLEPFLQGDPVRETRSFEVREAPLQDLAHSNLLARLDTEETRMRTLVAGRRHDPDPDTDFRVRLRSEGRRDLRVSVDSGTAALTWADDDIDEPGIDLNPAARHVFIWGRRPDRHGQARSRLSRPDLVRLQALLSGY